MVIGRAPVPGVKIRISARHVVGHDEQLVVLAAANRLV
jgi:hypothetical protein